MMNRPNSHLITLRLSLDVIAANEMGRSVYWRIDLIGF